MLLGIFSRCDSMGEVYDGMRALEGKLNYLGMEASPSKSTAGDALRDRSNELFRLYYFALITHFSPLLSVSRKKDVSLEQFYAFDSTTIKLFSDIMKGVGRNLKDGEKKKGGLKVHMLTDVHADTAVHATISEAKMHDRKFLDKLNFLQKGSMTVFDRACNCYRQFAQWTQEGINFVCRLKSGAKYEVQEVLFEKKQGKDESGVYKAEHIHLQYRDEHKEVRTFCLRLVHYGDEKGRKYKFITNNWKITDEEVALIYKYRWTIKLMFKKLKQNFQLHFFYSDTENGIKTQIWCTLIAHLLLTVIKHLSKSGKAFSTIAALIRIHLTAHGTQKWQCNSCRKYFHLSYCYKAWEAGTKEKITELTLNSSGVCDISRTLHINRNTVCSALKKNSVK
jgi:hypothetical protein